MLTKTEKKYIKGLRLISFSYGIMTGIILGSTISYIIMRIILKY